MATENALSEMLRTLWSQKRSTALDRVAAVQRFLGDRDVSPEKRRAAVSEAHKLAGALGSFGLTQGSEIARMLELSMQDEASELHWEALSRQAEELRQKVEDFKP